MAALDFPASPTNGQVYANWIYSTAKGAWQAKPITGKVTTSATAPSAPSNGDEWFNTNDGNLYVYYTDVDTSQWVQVKSDATLSSTLGSRVTTLETYPSGLVPIVPTSVTVGSGSASVNGNGQITLTGATSISINGVFTSSYRSYRVVANHRNSTNNNTTNLFMKFRASGVDSSSGDFVFGGVQYTTTVGGGISSGTWAAWGGASAHVGYIAPNSGHFISDVLNPNNAVKTGFVVQNTALNTVTGANYAGSFQGSFNSDQVFDGISLISGSDAFSGNITVYGYR